MAEHGSEPNVNAVGRGQAYAGGTSQRPLLQGPAAARPLRCYLVEDNALLRRDLVATLEDLLDLSMVGSAADQRTAVHWITTSGVDCDLMIIDLVLKAGSGLEVLRLAHRAGSQAKLVVLSNFATADIRERCRQLGADRVFDKSTELEELLAYCEDVAGPRLQ